MSRPLANRSRAKSKRTSGTKVVRDLSEPAFFSKLRDTFKNDTAAASPPMRRSGFGANELYVNGRIFAMLSSRNQLVFKLPAHRVRALTSLRVGARFDAGRGRLMREWLVLRKTSWQQAQALALEAFEFVRTTK